jgi:hypothetical protein
MNRTGWIATAALHELHCMSCVAPLHWNICGLGDFASPGEACSVKMMQPIFPNN